MIGARLHKNDKSSTEASGPFLSHMVTVYHHTKVNIFAKGRRHVRRNCFFHIAIELCLIKSWKGSLVHVRVCWFKDES
jgi:hypothetical protein